MCVCSDWMKHAKNWMEFQRFEQIFYQIKCPLQINHSPFRRIRGSKKSSTSLLAYIALWFAAVLLNFSHIQLFKLCGCSFLQLINCVSSGWFVNGRLESMGTVLLTALQQQPHHCCSFLSVAARPGKESSLWRPQLRIYVQRFPFPLSGQPRASRSADADVLPIPQPQLPESHPGWLFPRWRHSVHWLMLLTTSWLHCSYIQ